MLYQIEVCYLLIAKNYVVAIYDDAMLLNWVYLSFDLFKVNMIINTGERELVFVEKFLKLLSRRTPLLLWQ